MSSAKDCVNAWSRSSQTTYGQQENHHSSEQDHKCVLLTLLFECEKNVFFRWMATYHCGKSENSNKVWWFEMGYIRKASGTKPLLAIPDFSPAPHSPPEQTMCHINRPTLRPLFQNETLPRLRRKARITERPKRTMHTGLAGFTSQVVLICTSLNEIWLCGVVVIALVSEL